MTTPVFILGGAQTDFAINWSRAGEGMLEMMRAAMRGALDDASVDAAKIESVHVGNFVGELFTGQGHLGGLVGLAVPELVDVRAARHEAACASGGIAVLSAMSEIEAGRADCVLVVGVEEQRNVPGDIAAKHLGAAAWVGHEAQAQKYVWPSMFDALASEYERRYGLRYEHLAGIARINLDNAKRNPLAQTRSWKFTDASFREDDVSNPVISGRIRRQDCGQVTDGAAAIVVASARFASSWAQKRGRALTSVGRIAGWGHTTSTLPLADKLARSKDAPLVFPHVKRAIDEALARASLADVNALSAIETHDCFSMSEYMAIDHFGITKPGESFRAVDDGTIAFHGRLPINASGGLIGCGHPVGATGVRMLVDAEKQVTARAGAMQVEGAKRVGTLNIGGSATTVVSFVVEGGA